MNKPFTATITSKGQITIPAFFRKNLSLEKGDTLIFEQENNKMTVKKAQPIDIAYLSALNGTVAEEWGSEADNQAYNAL